MESRQDGEERHQRRRQQLLLQRDHPLRQTEAHLLGRFCQRLWRMFHFTLLGNSINNSLFGYFNIYFKLFRFNLTVLTLMLGNDSYLEDP